MHVLHPYINRTRIQLVKIPTSKNPRIFGFEISIVSGGLWDLTKLSHLRWCSKQQHNKLGNFLNGSNYGRLHVGWVGFDSFGFHKRGFGFGGLNLFIYPQVRDLWLVRITNTPASVSENFRESSNRLINLSEGDKGRTEIEDAELCNAIS